MRRYRRNLGLLAISTCTLLLTSCSNKNISGLGFPKGVSSVNDTSGPLWYWAWVTAGIVGVSTFILLMWPVFFHRKKSDEFPPQSRYNIPVEVAYTLIPFIIVAVLFAYTVRDQSRTDSRASVMRLLGSTDIEKKWPWKPKLFKVNNSSLLKLKISEISLTDRPDYRAALTLLQAERERSVRAHRMIFPSLDLNASYGLNGTGSFVGGAWNSGYTTTISLTMPFFDALQNQSGYRVQMESQSAAEVRLRQLERDIAALIKAAQETYALSIDTAVAREHTLETSRRLYETNARRLQQGRATANDVALDQQRLTDSELLDLQGWSNAHLAFVSLCHSLGRLASDCSN